MQLIHQYLLDSASRRPGKTAVICDERSLTYGTLAAHVSTLADQLIIEGLRRGDRVLMLVRDKCDLLLSSAAVLHAGGIAVLVPDAISPAAMSTAVTNSRPSMVITTREDLQEYPFLQDQLTCEFYFLAEDFAPGELEFIPGGETAECYTEDSLERITKLMNLNERDAAFIFNITDQPEEKRVVIYSHANIMRMTIGMNAYSGYDETFCEFARMPLYDPIGMGRALCVLFAGGTLVLTNGTADPATVIDAIRRHDCNALSIGSKVFTQLMGKTSLGFQRVASQIRFLEIDHSASPLGEKRRLLEVFPAARIHVCYGSFAAPRSAVLELHADSKKLDTAGRAFGYSVISICDEGGTPLDRGEIGEIFISGEHVSHGNWQMDNMLKISGSTENRYRSGDIGWIDVDGYVHVVGRIDETIQMAGHRISAAEVEREIHTVFPEYDICMVGLPDPAGIVGEIPVLCYIAREGKTLMPSELATALAHRLERYKIPKMVHRVEQFPRELGVILRDDLRRELLQNFCRGIAQQPA